MTTGNSPCSYFCLYSNGCLKFKSITKYIFVCICSVLDRSNPRPSKDAGSVKQSSAHQGIYAGLCPRPF